MFIVIVCSHIVFLLYWLRFFLTEMQQTIRGRFPRLYVALFLFCRQQRMEKEIRGDKMREKISPFLNKYEEAIECK
jgi:hypothetical protein